MHVHDNHDVERANLNIEHSISMQIYFFAIYSRGYPGCPYLSMAVGKVHATGKADLGFMSSECLMLRELLVSSREALLRGHRSQVRYGQMVDDTSRWP